MRSQRHESFSEHTQSLEELTTSLGSRLSGTIPEFAAEYSNGIKELGSKIKERHHSISIHDGSEGRSLAVCKSHENMITLSQQVIDANLALSDGQIARDLPLKLLDEHHPLAYFGVITMAKCLVAAADPDAWAERAKKRDAPQQTMYSDEDTVTDYFNAKGLRHSVNMRRNPNYLQERAIKRIEEIVAPAENEPSHVLLSEATAIGNLATYTAEQYLLKCLMKDMSRGQIAHGQRLDQAIFSQIIDKESGQASLSGLASARGKIESLCNFLFNTRNSLIETGSPQDKYLLGIKTLWIETNQTALMAMPESSTETTQESSGDLGKNQAETPQEAAKREKRERLQEIREQQEKIRQIGQNALDQVVAEFGARLQVRSAEWTNMSAKELKALGLSDLQFQLIKGVDDEDGNNILSGRTKGEAKDTLAFLLYLQRTDSEKLTKELEFEQAAATELADKEPAASEFNLIEYRKALEKAHPLSGKLETLKQEWPALRGAIVEHWSEGKELVASIDALLFPADSEEEQTTLEPITEEYPAPEADTDNVIDINERDVAAIAEQLDQLVLPPNPSAKDIKEAIDRIRGDSEGATEDINWERLMNLAKVSEQYGGRLFRSKKESLGGAPTYYVVLFSTENDHYAIAETPAKGNATYVVAESQAAASCLEILELPKADARELGAMRIIHRNEDTDSNHHLYKIRSAVAELETINRAA